MRCRSDARPSEGPARMFSWSGRCRPRRTSQGHVWAVSSQRPHDAQESADIVRRWHRTTGVSRPWHSARTPGALLARINPPPLSASFASRPLQRRISAVSQCGSLSLDHCTVTGELVAAQAQKVDKMPILKQFSRFRARRAKPGRPWRCLSGLAGLESGRAGGHRGPSLPLER